MADVEKEALTEAAREYIRPRRVRGFLLVRQHRQLGESVAFADRAGAPRVAVGLAIDWADLLTER